MPAPKRIDLEKLREIDPVLAEHVQTALARQKVKTIIPVNGDDLEPARLLALGEGPMTREGYPMVGPLKSFGAVAYKFVRESSVGRRQFLDFVSRLQGTVSEPSEASEQVTPERAIPTRGTGDSLWPRDAEGFVHCPIGDFKSQNVQSLVTHIGGKAQRDEAHAAIETPYQKFQSERRKYYEKFLNKDGLYECDRCGQTTPLPQGLAAHQRTHGIETPFSQESAIEYAHSKDRKERKEAAEAAQVIANGNT